MNRRALFGLPAAAVIGALVAKAPSAHALAFADVVDVTDYGLIGDDATDNLAALNVLIGLVAPGATLHFPPGSYRFSAAVAPTKRLSFRGAGKLSTALKTTSATADLFTIGEMGTRFEDVGLGSVVQKTAGAIVRCNVPVLTMRGVYVDGYFQGIVLNGATLSVIEDVFGGLQSPPTPGSVAPGSAFMVIGASTSAGIQLRNVSCNSPGGALQPSYGIFVNACMDLTMEGVQIMQHGINLAIGPGSGQIVASINAVNCYFDTATRGLLICPTGSGAVVRCGFTQCWFGSMTSDGVYVIAPAGTQVQSIRFEGCTSVLNAARGMVTSGPVDYYWITGCDLHGNALGGLFDAATGTHKYLSGNLA